MSKFHDADRMRMRALVRVAGQALPSYWPMRTFVHHNPLHGLEGLPFDEAVRQGERLFGGRGYLSAEAYRAYMHAGRIRPVHLESALQALAVEGAVTIGDRAIAHREVLRACMTHGLGEALPTPPAHDAGLAGALAERLAAHASAAPEAADAALSEHDLARAMTLADWCDRVLGTEVAVCVNDELIKWCSAFLDEGHATWPMPGREQGLYLAWRSLAGREWRAGGIAGSREAIRALPDNPEDTILESLGRLGVPESAWQDYLSLELAALPGWAGFIKWRAEHPNHPWQQVYQAGLVKYLAIRLWYVRELVAGACRDHLGIDGHLTAVVGAMRDRPELAHKLRASGPAALPSAAERLSALASALELPASAMRDADPQALATLLGWIDRFGTAERNAVWLRAFEAGYHDALLGMLEQRVASHSAPEEPPIRPQSQSVYCLDVRTEPFRRHLEAVGDHETLAFAGFFGAAIRFRRWGKEGYVDLVPAVLSPRNEVREVPRSYHEHLVPKHLARARMLKTGHALLRDLKENVVTPYVMVESLGWFYGLPLVGKTLLPRAFKRFSTWLKGILLPSIPTTLTVDKLTPAEVEEMVASEQRDTIWKALQAQFGQRGFDLDPHLVESIRQVALGAAPASELARAAEALGIAPSALEAFVETLRHEHEIEARSALRRKERLTRTGFTLDEQVATIETFLRAMGLTRNFARVVLVCAHGSTSTNNPYESALDCGACGGNEGGPNARTMAKMANNPKVRERLARMGIEIPTDTVFLAGVLDTTTLEVTLHDLEDVPAVHRKDVARLQEDLATAGRHTREEQLSRLPDVSDPRRRPDQVWTRSADWSQVRPEWGLSGNAAFIIGSRGFTKGLDLGGRVFLNSYDPAQDPNGRLLDGILTGPQLVAQWICMEHYFSTTADGVYGSGSKVYHNVAGRVGVMAGPSSDLRMGLASQTVMVGDRPFHEPMRLLTVVAARRATLEAIIERHEMLQNYYQHEWVHLVVIDPDDSRLYRYEPQGGWRPLSLDASQSSLGKEPMV